MGKELIIGLDVGSNSVGWAATDENFNLMRIKGKTAWGIRLFDEANDAKERRTFRSNRRRLQRRKYRISLLNSLLVEDIVKKDPNFLDKLELSNLVEEDRSAINNRLNNYIFSNRDEEKQFYDDFPTIWHLRKELLNPNSEHLKDIRKVYLALHHIIKYRGNFLIQGKININNLDNTTFEEINDAFNFAYQNIISEDGECNEIFEYITKENFDKLLKILKDNNKNVSDKKREINKIVNRNDDVKKISDLFVTLVSGGEFDLKKINEEEQESTKICFSKNYDNNESAFANILKENFSIVVIAKKIYDYIQINEIMANSNSISDAFDSIYEKHKKQLKELKDFVKILDKKKCLEGKASNYYAIFKNKNDKINNYCTYIGMNKESKKCSIEDFNKFIRNTLGESLNDFKDSKLILSNTYLETQSIKSTSLIPHQLHESELTKILDNASKYFKSIEQNKDKIIKIFRFRVPYFYGPLNNKSIYSSVVRLKNETVTPWNFDSIFDKNETQQKFINNLSRNCTYLFGEHVLPIQSIIYEQFNNLNKLNNLVINGSKIDQKTKDELYNLLVLKQNKITVNGIKKYLKKYKNIHDASISGVSETETFGSPSYILFKSLFNKQGELNIEEINKADEIINYLVIYKDNINDGIDFVKRKFCLDENQINKLKRCHFNGFGKLSKKLLVGIRFTDDNGIVYSILDLLKATTENFNQIFFNSEYKFNKIVDRYNNEQRGDLTIEQMVNNILNEVPPMFRRSTIQAYRIVDEIVKFSKIAPKYISLEVTRENDKTKKGKLTNSRYNELELFINALIKDKTNEFYSKNARILKPQLEKYIDDTQKLKNKHLYLYFKQNGIDLYTGKNINLDDVLKSDKYDVDHIVPQHLIKDDSLDNLVLVDRVVNQKIKKGIYPIPVEIRCNPKINKLWKFLHDKGSISNKKYNNLIRATEITESEENDFINRQINVINQSNVVLRDILQLKYPNTKIILSKAQYPSFIRKKYDLPKLRDLNDAHHAYDAFLNIISGVILYKEYNLNLIANRKDEKFTYNMENTITYQISKNMIEQKLYDYYEKHDCLMTYRQQYIDDGFYNTNISKKGATDNLTPIHTNGPLSDVNKYGGYDKASISYLLVCTLEDAKHKITKTLIGVPCVIDKICKNEKAIAEKLSKELNHDGKYLNIKIDTKHKIYPSTKIYRDGGIYLLVNSNTKLVKLKPFYISYLTLNDCRKLSIINKYSKFIDKNFSEDSIQFNVDRKGEHKIKMSKDINSYLYKKIYSKISTKPFNKIPYLKKIFVDEISFNKMNLYSQLEFLNSCLLLFTRNSESFKDKTVTPTYRLSKNSIFDSDVYLFNESITGLISKKNKIL